jgi:hypothetical protein
MFPLYQFQPATIAGIRFRSISWLGEMVSSDPWYLARASASIGQEAQPGTDRCAPKAAQGDSDKEARA